MLPERILTNKKYQVEKKVIDDELYDLYDPRKAPFSLHGLLLQEDGAFRRMPWEIAHKVSPKVYSLSSHTSGGRLRFVTDAESLALKVSFERLDARSIMSLLGSAGFDVYVETEGKEIFVSSFFPPIHTKNGFEGEVKLPVGEKQVTLYFPLYNDVSDLIVGLSKGASLKSPKPYGNTLPILFYGSSITQGACASRPGLSYVAQICRKLDSDFINLGFAGACKAEEEMLRYLATVPSSVFVLDYDHNASKIDYLQSTHYNAYRAYRDGNPDTPIVIVTRPDANPLSSRDRRRRRIIMDTYLRACKEGDEKVYFVDGFEIFEGDERREYTVDGTHPNDLGFARMAKIIGQTVARALKLG